ncbi:general amino acid permease [Colletotrichum tofieldiae]|nr:general amino acid permease [Colletotrichum tofieldiae]
MVTYVPVPSPFVRFAGEWVDEALGFAMAWNFFLNMAILVPFEVVAMSIMVTFWTDTVPIVAIIIPMIALYAFLNIITVRYFGISEFYLSIFKVVLMVGLFFFTFITMVGGNPLHEAYGFRYWQSPGAFVEHNASGNTGRFLGILSCIYQASFSPYIIAMNRLQIHVLPHIVNALIMTSVFSAGNGLLFSATRVLHGMSLTGYAPKIFSWCTKSGVPLYSLLFSLSFSLLAFLQLGSSSAEVLVYLVYLITCCQLLNYGFTALTYRHFYAALKKQGISRDTLPYKGRFQPYMSYIAMGGTLFMLLAAGYDLFLTGGWDVMWFFLDYGMIGFFILAFIGWKLVFKTRYVRPGTADISLGGSKEDIDQYESLYVARKPGRVGRLLNKVFE